MFSQNITFLFLITENFNQILMLTANCKIFIFNPFSDFLNNDLSFQSDTHVPKPVPVPDTCKYEANVNILSKHHKNF